MGREQRTDRAEPGGVVSRGRPGLTGGPVSGRDPEGPGSTDPSLSTPDDGREPAALPRRPSRWRFFQLPRIVRDLSGANSELFRAYLLAAMDATLEAARLVCALAAGELTASEAANRMRDIEHQGDAERAHLVADLRTALVTPIDREDLFRLSRAIDDILDNLRDFVRAWRLFEMDRSPVVLPVSDAVVEAVEDLRAAVEGLGLEQGAIGAKALAAKKSTGLIRRTCDQQLALLLKGEISNRMLQERELLRRLDDVGLRLRTAADALSDAVVKRAET
jgi:hypothetical protein